MKDEGWTEAEIGVANNSDQMLDKLLSLSGEAIGARGVDISEVATSLSASSESDLRRLLAEKNGFYAFEGALHVLSSSPSALESDLATWNSDRLWRQEYQDLAEGCVFFAEDIFGVQFGLRSGDICTFDPETGKQKAFASDLEDWARLILADYNLHTGYSLAHDWQLANPVETRNVMNP